MNQKTLFFALGFILLSRFAFSNEIQSYRTHLLALKPQALKVSSDTLIVQSTEHGNQYDYFWPATGFSISQDHFFALSEFSTQGFQSPASALLTLEFLQGMTLQSVSYLKGRPLPTPIVENCNHHEIVNSQSKAKGYSLVCVYKDKAVLVFSSFPMAPTWISKVIYAK